MLREVNNLGQANTICYSICPNLPWELPSVPQDVVLRSATAPFSAPTVTDFFNIVPTRQELSQLRTKSVRPTGAEIARNYNVGQKFLRYDGFPLVMGGAALGCAELLQHGVGSAPALAIPIIGALVASLAMERIIPYQSDWQIQLSDLLLDSLHNLVSTVGFVQLVKMAITPAVLGGSMMVSQALVQAGYLPSLWAAAGLADLSPVLQFFLASFGVDFPTYIAHRVVHEVPFLWPFHRIHHRPIKLNTLKGGFNNGPDALKELTHYIPLTFLGVPAPIVLAMTAMTVAKGFVQHSNSNFELGTLEYIVSGTKAHRWHHAKDERHNTNYGINWMMYDTLSAAPEFVLENLCALYPSWREVPGMSLARRFARKLNSLYMPDKDAPDDVGVEESDEIAPPGTPAFKQFLRDNFEPFVLSWRIFKGEVAKLRQRLV